MVFHKFFGRENDEIPAMLYAAIVAHARRPEFFSLLGVPDTLDGRFDILVLHAFLFFRRLKGEDEESRALGQAVFDTMFKDLDQAIREMGVSDIAVAKRIRKMASAFYGRIAAYGSALDTYQNNPDRLRSALSRNIFPGREAGAEVLDALARYVADSEEVLSGQDMDAFRAGTVRFANAPRAVSGSAQPLRAEMQAND